MLKDQRGQADLVGNFLELVKTQPWILLLVFLSLVYASTASLNIAGININFYEPLNAIFGSVFGVFGFGFDWRLIVIIIFLAIPFSFVLNGDNW